MHKRKGAIGFSNPDDDIYIPLATSQYRVTGQEQIQNISVQVAPGAQLAQAMVEIERVLRREHALLPGRDNDFALLDRQAVPRDPAADDARSSASCWPVSPA